MSIGLKVIVGLGLAFAVVAVSATAVVGSAALAGGVATISIHSPDAPDLNLAVPGVLISAAAATGSRLAAGHHDHILVELDHGAELAAAGRMMREMMSVLEEIPDATLVEVEDGSDLVQVVKRGRYLRVRIIDGGDDLDLEVSLPIRTARRTAAYLLG